MLDNLLQLSFGNNSVREFAVSVHQGIPSVAFGVSNAFKNYMISALSNKVLLVVKDGVVARESVKEISAISGKKVVYIPPKDDLLVMAKAFSKDTYFERIVAIKNAKDADVIVVSIETLMQSIATKIDGILLYKDQTADVYEVIKTLASFGYKRVEKVEDKGTFSLRGDLLDVFSIDAENPYRIDFFGDSIESIKLFDNETRKNLGAKTQVEILPCVEYSFSQDDKKVLSKALESEVKSAPLSAKKRLRDIKDQLILSIDSLDQESLGVFASFSKFCGTVFDLLDKNSTIIFDEAKQIYDSAELVQREFTERLKLLCDSGEAFTFAKQSFVDIQSIKDRIKDFRLGALQTLSTAIPFFNPLKIINPNQSGVANYQLDFKEVFTDIKNWQISGYKVLVFAGDIKRAEMFSFDLSSRGIYASVDGEKLQGVCVSSQNLTRGFVFHEEKIAVIGSGNLFAKSPSFKPLKKRKQAFFSAPEVGDYCVHEVHGIGRVLGNKKISTTEGTKDYLSVEYAGGDILSIPVEQMDILSRYLGADKRPKLSKIGGKDFDRIKNAVKESIKKMSFDIKKLYAERNALKGYQFTFDKYLTDAFNNAFPFELTVDQAQAEQDIKEDMTSARVMDRLVCGDVGFGKTEVAFRAIFTAIVNGKQVALLAPTTILTEQHYNTALERFKSFGIKIACLNRFRKKKEQEQILEGIKKGEIDLVIGTHRLLSKDVLFKDLGLLVLDEEQRFGVEHKERIKLLKKDVDTLTLTATPIPRTLHMSLSGMRDISTINTPPQHRLPVQTYVVEQTDAIIKDAVSREVNRGGQVFILYNRVDSIFHFSEYVKTLMPNVKITVAHGQMDEKALEKNVLEFYSGKTDVLISTTIIENGIDLPRANTLIVIDADHLGLSTLYQLKGRVGRSNRLAYAYFTFKREKVLSQTAYERLNAITDFTQMGSGIKIAMRDLEIRGAGNVLGAEQHGHMDKIGYELYSKLLKEELSGVQEIFPDLDVRVSAYIPEKYIESSSSRMDAYKEIASLNGKKDEKECVIYLRETFGALPKEVENLINISAVKRLGMKIGVSEIVVKKDSAYLTLSSVKALSDGKIMQVIEDSLGITLSMKDKVRIVFDNYCVENEQTLIKMRKFLEYTTA